MPGNRVRPLAGPSTSLVPGIHALISAKQVGMARAIGPAELRKYLSRMSVYPTGSDERGHDEQTICGLYPPGDGASAGSSAGTKRRFSFRAGIAR